MNGAGCDGAHNTHACHWSNDHKHICHPDKYAADKDYKNGNNSGHFIEVFESG